VTALTARDRCSDLNALETQRSQHPSDPDVNLRLARAYYAAHRYSDVTGSGFTLWVRYQR